MTSDDPKVAALRTDIAETRAALGETVEALAAKADVKARAQEKVADVKARAAFAATEAKDKARETAQQVADSSKELAHDLRSDPAATSRRGAERVRASVRERPKQWAVAAAALVAFAALVVRKRRRSAARRVNPQRLRDDWRREWKENQ
jgi:long-subunit acyl-CoA synthetase (AMP-forming)